MLMAGPVRLLPLAGGTKYSPLFCDPPFVFWHSSVFQLSPVSSFPMGRAGREMGEVRFSVGMTRRLWVLCVRQGLRRVEYQAAARAGERSPAPQPLGAGVDRGAESGQDSPIVEAELGAAERRHGG